MKDLPIALLFSPLLLAQGMWVRAKTPKLPEAEGAREGCSGSGPMMHLLILGDSAAAGVGVRDQGDALAGQLVSRLELDYTVEWRLVAKTGATTEDALYWLDIMDKDRFDVIVLSLGVNDVTSGVSRRKWIGQQRDLIEKLKLKFDPSVTILSAVPPMGLFAALPQPLKRIMGLQSGRFNRYARRIWGENKQCELLAPFTGLGADMMASDGFHPGEGAYRAWAEAVARVVRERFPV